MKKLFLLLITTVVLSLASQAFAFITVIDVKEMDGTVTSVQNPSDYSFDNFQGKYLTYRGNAEEAKALFVSVVNNTEFIGGIGKVANAEINPTTQTVAITVFMQGMSGDYFHYFILQKSGD